MIRVGKVVKIDEKRARVRVQFEDADGVVSYWLPVIYHKTQDDKFYFMPDLGELVVCAFYEDDWDTGVVIGAIYNEKDLPPVTNKDKFFAKFKDGTSFEYDKNSHKLRIHCVGDIEIVAEGNVTIIGKRIDLNP